MMLPNKDAESWHQEAKYREYRNDSYLASRFSDYDLRKMTKNGIDPEKVLI